MLILPPIKNSEGPRGEPVISLVCGVPALSIGLGAIVLLWLHLALLPLGSENFYKFERVGVNLYDPTGRLIKVQPVDRLIPTPQLQGMLFAGMCSAGLGVHLSRWRWPHRRITTSAAGIITCALAFFAGWILIVMAALV
jgi:hypothetical protein